MRSVVILVTAASIYSGAHNPVADEKLRLAQAVTRAPTVTPPPPPSTPVTSTVTNCMMSCNSQAANCYPGCLVPTPPVTALQPSGKLGTSAAVTLNATVNTACSLGCASTLLACHTICARSSPSQ